MTQNTSQINNDANTQLKALTEEVEILTQSFKSESAHRLHRLNQELESAQHHSKVLKQTAVEQIAKGVNAINKAATNILLPDEE